MENQYDTLISDDKISSKIILPVTNLVSQYHPFLAENSKDLHLLIVQHLLDDTAAFIECLAQFGFRSITVIGVPYSVREVVVDRLRGLGCDVLAPSSVEIDSAISKVVLELVQECERSNGKLLIIDVGGRCCRALIENRDRLSKLCKGVVEDTTFGRRVYEQFSAHLPIPIWHVSDSMIKDLEAIFVGEAVATELQSCLTMLGVRLSGTAAGVLGFGPIGRAVSNSMRQRLARVSVFDVDTVQLARASFSGFTALDRQELLAASDVIIGATGFRSVNVSDLALLPNGCVLCSASSGQIELPMEELPAIAVEQARIGKSIARYHHTFTGKGFTVISDGYPINFMGQSVPNSVIDLVFSEIYLCALELSNDQCKPGVFSVKRELEAVVASAWWTEFRESGRRSPS